jgi:hypothetical protein
MPPKNIDLGDAIVELTNQLKDASSPENRDLGYLVGAVGIESTNCMEIKELCGAARPSKSFKGTQRNS